MTRRPAGPWLPPQATSPVAPGTYPSFRSSCPGAYPTWRRSTGRIVDGRVAALESGGSAMAIDVHGVGHVVLKVTDVERALGFYCGVLGLTEVARAEFGNGPMVFLSSGRHHHDIALVEVGADARR